MQTVAAYLMELDSPDDPSSLDRDGAAALHAVESWLTEKDASDASASSGTYSAVDGSAASFHRSTASDGSRKWTLIVLEEVAEDGRIFRTSVSVTVGVETVAVFVTMQVGTTAGGLTRVDANPKCPAVVRSILALPGKWHHSGSPLLTDKLSILGERQGEYIAELLQNETRSVPFVVVSQISGKEAISGISDQLAYDLAGLANVITIDVEAARMLTAALGKTFSVFDGAIRLYWPDFDESTDSPFRHQLWTATKLKGLGENASWRFRNGIRKVLMEASAASITRPPEIDEIRSAQAKKEYAELSARSAELDRLKSVASSITDYEELADSYARDNDLLREQVGQRDSRIIELEAELTAVSDERRALRYHLEQAGAVRGTDADLSPDSPAEADPPPAPRPGEVRFYKKIYSTRGHDVLVSVGGCDHTAWQSSNGADKARKGLQRLGLPEWKRLQHCGTCTGGGMWRVEW